MKMSLTYFKFVSYTADLLGGYPICDSVFLNTICISDTDYLFYTHYGRLLFRVIALPQYTLPCNALGIVHIIITMYASKN